MILTALATGALSWLADLAKDKGEELVIQGVKKVTGIDLNKTSLTPADEQKILDHKLDILKLDFEKVKEEEQIKDIDKN